VKIPWS